MPRGRSAGARRPSEAGATTASRRGAVDRPDDLRRTVEESGIPVLHNRSVELRRAGQTLSLAGVAGAVCLAAKAGCARPARFYVATNGRDAWSGSQAVILRGEVCGLGTLGERRG